MGCAVCGINRTGRLALFIYRHPCNRSSQNVANSGDLTGRCFAEAGSFRA
jgi:hypothetical protein